MQEIIYTDQHLMPYGKYKGKMLVHVPAEYFLWLYDNSDAGAQMYDKKLLRYIKENFEAFKMEVIAHKQQKKYERR